jgi:hypothetical protein
MVIILIQRQCLSGQSDWNIELADRLGKLCVEGADLSVPNLPKTRQSDPSLVAIRAGSSYFTRRWQCFDEIRQDFIRHRIEKPNVFNERSARCDCA